MRSFGRKYQDVSENEHFLEILSVDIERSENVRQISCFFLVFITYLSVVIYKYFIIEKIEYLATLHDIHFRKSQKSHGYEVSCRSKGKTSVGESAVFMMGQVVLVNLP